MSATGRKAAVTVHKKFVMLAATGLMFLYTRQLNQLNRLPHP
jgi:hypothetical protein